MVHTSVAFKLPGFLPFVRARFFLLRFSFLGQSVLTSIWCNNSFSKVEVSACEIFMLHFMVRSLNICLCIG